MDSEDTLHRLEGSKEIKGGLVVKKKPPTFKVPQPSLFGLDKLAEKKRKEREEAARKISFVADEETNQVFESPAGTSRGESREQERKFRIPQEETPTYTGGLTSEARARFIERLNSNKNREKGVYASTKSADYERGKDKNDSKYLYRERERYKGRHGESRHNDRYDHDRHHSKKRSRNDRDSSRRERSPKFQDEPKTPNLYVKDSTSKSSWDEDDPLPAKKSAWDYPTPTNYKKLDWSERSNWSSYNKSDRNKDHKLLDDTPRPTPAHKYNAWMKDRRKTGATPGNKEKDDPLKWESTVDRENWEEEQKRIDREWYNMDEGYDDEHNPFASVSDEYTKKKEEQLEQRKKKRLSAQQRQINKDNELWERNRMLTSGKCWSFSKISLQFFYVTTDFGFFRCCPLS